MAISRVKTWIAEILTAADLNAEFNNILDNALALVSPWTGNMAAGGFRLTGLGLGTVGDPSLQLTGDTNTGWYSSAADTLDGATGGVRAASFGASWLLSAAPEDARTATVDVVGEIRSTTSGIPAANIGVGVLFSAESADENPSDFGRLDFVATDVTAASEDTVFDILLRTAGAALGGRYRFQATGAFLATVTSALTANRTITLQDATDTLVGRDTTDTLTNKTLGATTLSGTLSRAADQIIDLTGAATRTLTIENSTASQVCNLDLDGNLIWRSGTAFTMTLDHAATANRLHTIADVADDTFAMLAAAQTLSGKTLASPIFTTSMTGPLLIGGTAVGSTMALRSTSGIGSSDAILFQVGNNGATEAGRFTTGGVLLLGTTTVPANMTLGHHVDQGTNDNAAFSLASTGDVNHLVTSQAPAATYASFGKVVAVNGGLLITGITDGGTRGFQVYAISQADDTAKTTGALGNIYLNTAIVSGAGPNATAIGADANMIAFGNNGTTRHILDGDGDSHQDVGTAWTNFDDYDDVSLLDALAIAVAPAHGDALREGFVMALHEARAQLEALPGKPIISFNADGHHFANMSRVTMLLTGGVRQLSRELTVVRNEITDMRRRLAAVES